MSRIVRLSMVSLALAGLHTLAFAQATTFTDQTASAGIDSIFNPSGSYPNWDYTGGGTTGDFNNDGWQDLFLLRGRNGGVDRLYINNQDGTFTDQAAAWGLGPAHDGKGISVCDYDGDGFLDVYITSAGTSSSQPGKHLLYHNDNGQGFTEVAAQAGVQFTTTSLQDGWGSTWGDYDLDGDADLFVAGTSSGNLGSRLFRNENDGTFTDVTAQIGLFAGVPDIWGFAPRFADMDGDWYPELLFVGDFGTSRYFENNGDGTFTEATGAAGLGQEENGMGQCVGFFDADDRLDFYVTSIIYPASGWTGNKLYYNLGNHSYSEVGQVAGVYDCGYAWGAVAADFNHDGLQDITATNGDSGFFINDPTRLYINNGNGTFHEEAVADGIQHTAQGRGYFNLDYDNDGDQDLLLITLQQPARLYRNEATSNPNTHWLRVLLDTSLVPALVPNGLGARVSVTVAGTTQWRQLTGGDNFLSSGELSLHFGLRTATTVDTLNVYWPNGQVTTLTNVAADQTLTVAASTVGTPFCLCDTGALCGNVDADSGCANSTGTGSTLAASGSASVAADDLVLFATDVPTSQFGLVFMGLNQAPPLTFGDGLLCFAPTIIRYPVTNSGGAGMLTLGPGIVAFSLAHFPASAQIGAGQTWSFQAWYRDPTGPCGAFYSLSNGLEVAFTP